MLETLQLYWNDIMANPLVALGVVANLVLIESLLSVDNAAVLATMVMDLPKEDREKALKYGIIGAYVFRGICLVLAQWLLSVWYLKGIGGLYLLWLAISYFKGVSTPQDSSDDVIDHNAHANQSWFYKMTVGWMGMFWSTVISIEVMDLAFSIDNVFAAVAYSKNLLLIWTGVFIGILAMRFVAQAFVKLMEKYPFLETAAFVVIAILGIKLSLTFFTHYNQESSITHFLEGQMINGKHEESPLDMWLSIGTVAIFVVPILTSKFLGWPAQQEVSDEN
jgi:YkoY family integral membrane protein